jgi:hypothetical protein
LAPKLDSRHFFDLSFFQMAILNFTPSPQEWTWPLGMNLTPRDELDPKGWTWPLGVNFVPKGECSPLCSPSGVNTLYCLEEWKGKYVENFTPRG